MPYVRLAPTTRTRRSASAAVRWEAILRDRPELGPAIDLQRELLTTVADLVEVLERGRLPRLSLPPKYLAAKLKRGIPALAGEPIPVPVAVLKPALLSLCDALASGGAGDAARHIRAHLDETRMDAGSLLTASLNRDQASIRTAAEHSGLAPDLLWLVAELAVSPFVYALQRAILASAPEESAVRGALDAWCHGYCAHCGSWPALAELAASHRVLRCSFCAWAWELDTYACVYCGEDGEKFVTAAPNAEHADRRLEVCGTCASYLKTLDVAQLTEFPLLAIADLETMDLDVAAMERGYHRPAAKEFAKR